MTRSMEPSAGAMRHLLLFLPLLALAACKPPASDDYVARVPIEERAAAEVTHWRGVPVAPPNTQVMNPAFDVTPNRYVAAIITEKGVARSPFVESLRELAGSGAA